MKIRSEATFKFLDFLSGCFQWNEGFLGIFETFGRLVIVCGLLPFGRSILPFIVRHFLPNWTIRDCAKSTEQYAPELREFDWV